MKSIITLTRKSSKNSRHLLNDFRCLLQNTEKVPKIVCVQRNEVKELLDSYETENMIFFESKKNIDYIWFGNRSNKTLKFRVLSLFTMQELSFPINFYEKAGVKAVFDKNFEQKEELIHVKEVFQGIFQNEEPVCDRVFSFYYFDTNIWIRVYVVNDEGSLCEVGPRVVLQLDKVMDGCFGGKIIYGINGILLD